VRRTVRTARGSASLSQPFGFSQFRSSNNVHQKTGQNRSLSLEQFHPIYEFFDFVRVGEEPWQMTPSFAVVLAATLSILQRPLLDTVPLFGVSAPVAGGGKTKLVETISASTTGLGLLPSDLKIRPSSKSISQFCCGKLIVSSSLTTLTLRWVSQPCWIVRTLPRVRRFASSACPNK
jgi:hypothetical protein